MAIQDCFTDEERKRQLELDRSRDAFERDMANPADRARLRRKIDAVLQSNRVPGMTGDEFLESVRSET